jgi:uncharacterized membrane protein
MTRTAAHNPRRTRIPRSIWSGLLTGIGTVAFVDETVFHQLLHWHHFYDKSGTAAGLVSDGLFHAAGFVAVVAGLFLLADLRRRRGLVPKRWWGGFLLGLGGFQVYDGLIQHKVLQLHQIRYHVTIWPYDTTWNVLGGSAALIGVILLLGQARPAREDERDARTTP